MCLCHNIIWLSDEMCFICERNDKHSLTVKGGGEGPAEQLSNIDHKGQKKGTRRKNFLTSMNYSQHKENKTVHNQLFNITK